MTGTHFPDAAQQRRLPFIALALAFVLGPLGAALGTWLAVRTRRAGQRIPGLAAAAVVVGIVQTVAVAAILWTPASAVPPLSPNPTPTPSRTYPSWETPSQPSIAVATPTRPLPSSLESYAPATVGPFKAAEESPDKGTIDEGATNATTASYASAKKSVNVVTAEWPSAEAAQAHLKARAAAKFGDIRANLTAPIPSGSMSYYALDGQGTIYTNQGRFTMVITGGQAAVEDFWMEFPA